MATVYGFAIYGADLLTRLHAPGSNEAIMIALFCVDALAAAGVAFFDIGLSARTALILESISVTIILILSVNIWVHNGTVFDTRQLTLTGVKPGGILVGCVLAIFAFVGFESAGSLGVESKAPFRNVPRAILSSCLIVGLFYVVVSYSQIYGFKGVKGGILGSTAPLPDLATHTGIGFFAYVLDLGIIASMFACTLACINAGARLLYSMARDGIGHQTVGSVHHARNTPHIAIAIGTVPMIAIPVITTIASQSAVNATGWVGTVATFGFMLGYALVGIGAPVFLRRAGLPASLAWGLGLLGAASMAFVFWANWLPQYIPGNLFPALSGAYVWLPYVFLGWVAIGAGYYAVWRTLNPEKASQVGTRYHTAEEAEAPAAAPASLPVPEAVEETAEDAALAGKGGAGRWRDGALAGDGLVVVGAGDRVDDLGLIEVLGAFDLGHVADEHAVAHDLGLEPGRAVGVPLGFAAARQRHADAELADAAPEQVSVDATVTEGVDHTASPEFVHASKIAFVPERSLNVRAVSWGDHTALVARSRFQRRRSEIPPWKAMYSGWTRSRPHFSL
jgi:amino acid transporter